MGKIEELTRFILDLDDWHKKTLNRENEFKVILGDYGFSSIKYKVSNGLVDFKKDVLRKIVEYLLRSELANVEINVKELVDQSIRETKDHYINEFEAVLSVITTKIDRMTPNKEELSLKSITKAARYLLKYTMLRSGGSTRKKNILQLRGYIYNDNPYLPISSYAYKVFDGIEGLHKLTQISGGVDPSQVNGHCVSSLLRRLANDEKTDFFGKWRSCGSFEAKFHKNGNIYAKFSTEDKAIKVDALLGGIPNA